MWIELNTADPTATRPVHRRTLVPVESLTVRERRDNVHPAEVLVGSHWRVTTETYDEILDRLREALGLEHLDRPADRVPS